MKKDPRQKCVIYSCLRSLCPACSYAAGVGVGHIGKGFLTASALAILRTTFCLMLLLLAGAGNNSRFFISPLD